MATAESRPDSNSAPPWHTSTTVKELANHSPGKGSWEDNPSLAIQNPAGSKASWAFSSCIPFLETVRLQCCVMSVTSIGDARHGADSTGNPE